VITIQPCTIDGSFRSHQLPETLSADDISTRLGFPPNGAHDPSKSTTEWSGRIDGQAFAIWDYRGHRWSAYDPRGRLRDLFPELVEE
jgi:hypothetical protein